MAAEQRSILLHGVDFTSAPRPKKGITIASGYLQNDSFVLESLSTLHEFSSFITWLQQPGPWLGGFDFPFSFPRELIELLGWPGEWAARRQFPIHARRWRQRLPWPQWWMRHVPWPRW